MTTTNKAFIDAYNSSRRAAPVRASLSTAESMDAHVVITDSVAMAVETIDTSEVGDWASSPASEPQTATRRPSVRRPLSQVQADELFGFQPQRTQKSAAYRWPEMCQQLVARAADRYDSLLRQLAGGPTGTLVGVVGVKPGAGCTTTSICLALRSSALGRRTSLVDGDIVHGGLAKALGVSQYASWPEVLAAGESIQSALVPADDVGIDLLLGGSRRSTDIESATRFRASLAAGSLRRHYERVVIDLGNVARGEVSLATSMGIDYLFATRTPDCTDADVRATVEALTAAGLGLAGVIEAA
jgi:Mrp family chromosome partitioning ATPase